MARGSGKRGRPGRRGRPKSETVRSEEIKAIRWVDEESAIRDEVVEWLRESSQSNLYASEAVKLCIKYIHRHRDEIDPVDILTKRRE